MKIKAGAGGIAEIGTIKQENSNCLTAWNQNFKTARNYLIFMVLSEVFTRIINLTEILERHTNS